jgi:NAD(P)-dependent dehydrogenase (short-subunit alcohol dehydrogenase family)
LIDTEMAKPLIDAGVAASPVPARRVGTGGEIVAAVAFLVVNGYIAGRTLAVNCGASFA